MTRLVSTLAAVVLLSIVGISAQAADWVTNADLAGLQSAVPATPPTVWRGGYCPQSYGYSDSPYQEYYVPRYYGGNYLRPYYPYGRPVYYNSRRGPNVFY
jgi:hypothetical protein